MSLDVWPAGAKVSRLPSRSAPPTEPAPGGRLADVYELPARDRGVSDVPASVWDEVDRAAQIAADLDAMGRSVRFTRAVSGGRVRAELVHGTDNVLRPVSLGEVITMTSTDPPAAA